MLMTSRGKSGEGSGQKVSGAFYLFVWGFSGLLSKQKWGKSGGQVTLFSGKMEMGVAAA